MTDFKFLPPDPYTAFVAPGDVAWRDYFMRQQGFLKDVVKTKAGYVLTKGRFPFATDGGVLIDDASVTFASIAALVAAGPQSYIPLALGSEPLQLVSDGAGQQVLMPFTI